MSCYESYQDTTESFSKCTELRDNVSLCLKGLAGLNIISFLTKRKHSFTTDPFCQRQDAHVLSRSNLRGKYLFFFNLRSRSCSFLSKKDQVWVLLIVGICYQLQKTPKRNFRIPFCVLFPFRLYSEHMDLCFCGASAGRFLFLNILQSQTPLLAELLSQNTFYLSQTKAF